MVLCWRQALARISSFTGSLLSQWTWKSSLFIEIRFLGVNLFSALFFVTISHSVQKSNGIRRVFAKVLSPLYQSVSVCISFVRQVRRVRRWRLFAAYRQAHWLGHSDGAAGAFLGLIGLLGLIGQRLTERQTFFYIIFCGAAPALRFNRWKNPFDYASSVSHRSLMSQMSHLSSPKIKLPHLCPTCPTCPTPALQNYSFLQRRNSLNSKWG